MSVSYIILAWIGIIVSAIFLGLGIWVGITEEKTYYYGEREDN